MEAGVDRQPGWRQHGFMKRPGYTVLAVLLLGTAVGCTDLDEVAQLRDISARAKSTLPLVSKDISRTCERQAVLEARLMAGAITAVSLDCAPYRTLAAHLAADEGVLTDYLDALAALASGGNFTYGKTVDAGIASLGALAPAPGANVALVADAAKAGTAALTLAGKLTSIITRHAREREVRSLILNSNDAVQTLTGALGTIGTTDYPLLLSNEDDHLKQYYAAPLAMPHADPMVSLLLQRQYDTDEEALARHREAAVDYGKVMGEIGTIHGKLAVAAREPATFAQAVKMLAPDLLDLRDAVLALQTEVR